MSPQANHEPARRPNDTSVITVHRTIIRDMPQEARMGSKKHAVAMELAQLNGWQGRSYRVATLSDSSEVYLFATDGKYSADELGKVPG